jgi:uncharacterized protein VirK/YbjX
MMVLSLLARHWLARRHYPLPSWLACIARSLRVLLFQRAHRQLLALDVHHRYVAQAHDDVFHHLSHRHYLARGLSLRQRVRCVLIHYRFEEFAFDAAYKRAVYRDGGLLLWAHEAGGCEFAIRLEMASRLNAEGDLTISASAGGTCLHRLSFSWIDAGFAGIEDPGGSPILPFIARNQGHHAGAADARDAFERTFPNNSPRFFCFAALQGIAQALGMDQVVAVKSTWQCAWDPLEARHFENAYDGFWQTLGGVPMAGRGWRIALPLNLRPLEVMPSRHRKRALMRREHWRAIGDSARLALRPHLVNADAWAP